MRLPKFLSDALTAAEQGILNGAMETIRFSAGTCIFRTGMSGDGCYVIAQGDVRLELENLRHIDTECVLGYLKAGSLLGEMSLLDELPRSVSAFAETDVVARRLSAVALRNISASHPQIGVALFRALGRDVSLKLRRSNDRIAELSSAMPDDPEVDQMVVLAGEAQRQFETWTEHRVDALLQAVAQAVARNAESLAVATVQETRIGNVADKTCKNLHASLDVYRSLAGKIGAGVICRDLERHVTEIASPAGVVFAILPITNPVATAVFKTLISLKARCGIILSFHRACLGVGGAVCDIMERVLTEHEAPANLMQWVRSRSSRNKTAKFMGHPGISLILATGSLGLVKAAYRSGPPALGVGPGNTPVYIAADAEIEGVARCIISSKPYDNGLICGAEHNLVVEAEVRDALVAALEQHGAAVLNPDEAKQFAAQALRPDGRSFIDLIIGQDAKTIAAAVGILRSGFIKLIVVPVPIDAVEDGSPFAREKLAPLLSLFTVRGNDDGFALCRRILATEGAGHTAIIHTQSRERADQFGLAMPAGRILVNTPGVQGICGITTGLTPSYTLGCGTWGGNSTTDNVSYRNLQNIKRLANFIAPGSLPIPA
jgi:acetaldehyde dehydrogenase/alcohol dehydrogenase